MGRPRKKTFERVADVLDKAAPEERAQAEAQILDLLRKQEDARRLVLEAEKEKIHVQAAALNDPKFKIGGEVMSAVFDKVLKDLAAKKDDPAARLVRRLIELCCALPDEGLTPQTAAIRELALAIVEARRAP